MNIFNLPINERIKDNAYKRLLSIWKSMKVRCNYIKHHNYHLYGARGICVSQEFEVFKDFYNWSIKNGYKDDLQIDRIDTDGDYKPSNCRWVTSKENSRNKRNNRVILVQNDKLLLTEIAAKAGVTKKTISDRIERGWTEEELLLNKRKRNNIRKHTGKTFTIDGVTKSYVEWAAVIGISVKSFWDRVEAGWKDDELLLPKGSIRKKINKQ